MEKQIGKSCLTCSMTQHFPINNVPFRMIYSAYVCNNVDSGYNKTYLFYVTILVTSEHNTYSNIDWGLLVDSLSLSYEPHAFTLDTIGNESKSKEQTFLDYSCLKHQQDFRFRLQTLLSLFNLHNIQVDQVR